MFYINAKVKNEFKLEVHKPDYPILNSETFNSLVISIDQPIKSGNKTANQKYSVIDFNHPDQIISTSGFNVREYYDTEMYHTKIIITYRYQTSLIQK